MKKIMSNGISDLIENLTTIEEVYSALGSDKKIQEQVEKIKAHMSR